MSSFVSNCNSNFIPDFKKYAQHCPDLRESFSKKFQDLNGREVELSLFQQPFRVNVEDITHDETQMEVLDFQANTDLKAAFMEHGFIKFYCRLDDESYPMIPQNVRFWICQFGSTYCCQQAFSVMNLSKSPARDQLTDEHLDAIINVAISLLKTN